MILEKLTVGSLEVNVYILGSDQTGEAIVIDPGAEGDRILNQLSKLDLELKYIINTHGHYDHIGANQKLLDESEAKLLIYTDEAEYLTTPQLNLSSLSMNGAIEGPAADRLLTAGEQIKCGEWELEVIHTPGHTPGGISLVGNGKLFAGDTLFAQGVGRTDFPGGSKEKLMESIQNKLLPLDDDLEVHPGHGPSGQLGAIKRSNPFL
ncbi:MAG: MBL fold metallo-hydrolase [Bacillota bacterium]